MIGDISGNITKYMSIKKPIDEFLFKIMGKFFV